MQSTLFQLVTGKQSAIMNIITMTRPDIAYAVEKASQFCQNPGDGHWNGVKRIFAYLAGSAHLGLCFDGQQSNNLIGFTDSDFPGNMDNRRSTSGFVFLFMEPQYHGAANFSNASPFQPPKPNSLQPAKPQKKQFDCSNS